MLGLGRKENPCREMGIAVESKRGGSGKLEVDVLELGLDLASAFYREPTAWVVAREGTLRDTGFLWTS